MNRNIRQVWRFNVAEEMDLMIKRLSSHPFIAIDTEFPGCLRTTPPNASESERYADMKFNVDNTKLIQFGFTLLDSDCRIGGTWEVNFAGFRETDDARNEDSIAFLRRNGLDFEKIREYGVSVHEFFGEFLRILRHQSDLIWVTFHGTYDIAYLLRMLTGLPLPRTSHGFAYEVGKTLGRVYDMKAMAARLEGLTDRLGLEKLARELGVSRVGSAHHAGSDSLLTARAFVAMAARCEDLCDHEGFVYGIASRVVSRRPPPEIVSHKIYGPPMCTSVSLYDVGVFGVVL